MRFRRLSDQRGFTLIELLIVVTIIGILAAIAVPQFVNYRNRAFNSIAISDMKAAKISIEAYYMENMYYPDN